MNSYGRNNNCWGNARIPPPSTIISSRTTQYRNGDLNLRFKQTAQSNTTSLSTNSPLGFHPKAGKYVSSTESIERSSFISTSGLLLLLM